MQRLFLLFENHSGRTGTVCVYQTDPGLAVEGLLSLAWLTKKVQPTTRVAFTWQVAYSFVWYDSADLDREGSCVASQLRPASLDGLNQVTLSRTGHGFAFGEATRGPQTGGLYVEQDGTVPRNRVAVGLGMAGHGSLVVPGQPNLTYHFQAPDPEYWITFGDFHQGAVIDPRQLAVPVAQVTFPDNVCAMTATLDPSGHWTVQPTDLFGSGAG